MMNKMSIVCVRFLYERNECRDSALVQTTGVEDSNLQLQNIFLRVEKHVDDLNAAIEKGEKRI